MNPAFSEQRKAASSAISEGFPMRPMGWYSESFSNMAGRSASG